jgi:membrane-bound serine protease (ClpP class)
MSRIIRLLLLLGLVVAAFIAIEAQAASPTIAVLEVKGSINPVLVDYLERGMNQAEEENAVACIIQMDTPGGLDTSMRLIIQAMDRARIPIVVYIPSGARAASAGFFITIAADIAAMAPDTAIGAAHPVAIGTEGEAQMSETMEAKVVNDAVAYAKGIAKMHGRNEEWAEKAVRDAASVPAHEALELNVIDIVAPNLDSLISQLDGRQVTMPDSSVVTIHTEEATINRIKMNTMEDFLYTIADPNIAYILLSIAMMGIMAEIFSPGLIFPGLIGGICGLLAFYSLGMLPVNWAGVLLIVLAFGLFISELFTHSFGLLTAGGITSLVIGSLILFKGGTPSVQIHPWLIATVVIVIAAFLAFVVQRIIRAHRRQATTGKEELVGKTAVVKVALDPEGMVLFKGERWTAVSEKGRIKPGEEVIITKVEGLKLYVTKK